MWRVFLWLRLFNCLRERFSQPLNRKKRKKRKSKAYNEEIGVGINERKNCLTRVPLSEMLLQFSEEVHFFNFFAHITCFEKLEKHVS